MSRVPLVTGAYNVIEQLRQAQGLSRTDLARRLNVSKAYVTQTLNGSRNMTLSTLDAFAGALGAEVEITARPTQEDQWDGKTGRLHLQARSPRKRKRTTRSSG